MPRAKHHQQRQKQLSTADVEKLTQLYNHGPTEVALALAQSLIQQFPKAGFAWKVLGALHLAQGNNKEALAATQKAITLLPEDAATYNNLGSALLGVGQYDAAKNSFLRALKIAPDYAKALTNLGKLLKQEGKLAEAEVFCRQASLADPTYMPAHLCLGNMLELQNKPSQALKSYRTALKLSPETVLLHSDVLHLLSLDAAIDARQLSAEHKAFGTYFEPALRPQWLPHTNTKDPERRLHIGFVSSDLFDHAMASYLEPLFKYLERKPNLVLHIFYSRSVVDAITLRLRDYLAHWHDVVNLSDADLASYIRNQGIDILVDLSGHTAPNRLLTFARKPAPVQITWLGYLGTTGLTSIDYYVADKFWLPPTEFEEFFSEHLAYLPAAMVFEPNPLAPAVNELPALSRGYMTFGSFNRLNKINHATIALWARLLQEQPNSKMVMGAIAAEFQEELQQQFEEAGITRDRLSFLPRVAQHEFLGYHNQVDLCLDTYPFGGGATLAHALWMGVPTLCVIGDKPASRFGAAELHHLGLDTFITHSSEEFVEQGRYWCSHLTELAALRKTMRQRFFASPLGDYPGFADHFEALFRSTWQRWCADLPVQSLSIMLNPTSHPAHSATEPSPQILEKLNSLYSQQHHTEAEHLARQLVADFPDHGLARKVLGFVLHSQGRLQEALQTQQTTAQLRPQDYEAHFNLACEYQQQGLLDDAVKSYVTALSLQPNNPTAYNNLGNIFKTMGLFPEAETYCRLAVELQPNLEKAHSNLGNALHAQGKYVEAQACYRRALEIRPEWAEVYNNLAITLKDQGRGDEAKQAYAKALQLNPDSAATFSNLLYALSHDVHITPQELLQEHLAFGQRFEPSANALRPTHRNLKDASRVLRIGFVSGDFFDHALTNFMEPMFRCLSGNPELELHAYYTHFFDDSVTKRIQQHFAAWNKVAELDAKALATRIEADRIDILMDMSGHTANNRLQTFALKPAPIQISWLGYLGTSGLHAIDYYVCDKFWIPPELDWQLIEKPAYLPSAVIFQPSTLAPPVNPLPAIANGFVTFGSFNRANKLNPSVLVLWSMLLKRVPTARMVFGGISEDSQHDFLKIFSSEGIDLNRLTFYPRSNLTNYLTWHHQVDFCLDAYPFGGGATNMHAAWMGVPTLCLAGETPASRLGATEMHHLGLDGFVASSIDEFLDMGCYWAEHMEELASIRAEMREWFKQSPLSQFDAFANHLNLLLRAMWQRWCDGLAPAVIEVNSIEQNQPVVQSCVSQAGPSDEELTNLTNLYQTKEFPAAVVLANALIDRWPAHSLAWKILGYANQAQSRYADSVFPLTRGLELDPDDATAHNNLGVALLELNRGAEAEIQFRSAVAIDPNYAKALINLATVLQCTGQFQEAESCCRTAITIDNSNAGAHIQLGKILEEQGHQSEAQACYYRADMAHEQRREVAHSNVLYLLNHDVLVEPGHLFAEHVAFGTQFEAPFLTKWPAHKNSKDPDRILQIGFVSGDLNHHALANFLEPVFEQLARRPSLRCHAFYTKSKIDDVTQRMRGHFAKWHSVAALDDAQLAERVRAEQIDILIDLSGHTAKNRLLAFARKPAPVQVSWLGYLGSTGLQSVDYYLCDPYWIPKGVLDWQFVEKLAYLPSAVTFQPDCLAPAVNSLPALDNKYLTFGSFNRPNKINESVIALWAMLLRKITTARLVLGAIAPDTQGLLIQSFECEGISADRLEFAPRVGTLQYLALHHKVDICLDTFPHSGGATTAHAAWMGVPTLCLAGETPASRFGATLMHHLGLENFVSTTIDNFVDKGVDWSQHIVELAQLRASMRARFSESALCQPKQFADNLEAAFKSMWHHWCNGDSPEHLLIDSLTLKSPNAIEIQRDPFQTDIQKHQNLNLPIFISALMQMAASNEEAGNRTAASHLYLEILKIEPKHHQANHRLGLLEVQLIGALEALPRLETAVQEQPECEEYWVSYIQGLITAGAVETAANAIEFGMKYGLSVTVANQLAQDFVNYQESRSSTTAAPEIDFWSLPAAPSWPEPPASETADLSYISPPESKGRRYVIVSPIYRHNSAGIRVMHDLQKWLVLAGYDAIVITSFAGLDIKQFEDDIALYPEVVYGNPLKCQRVVRYILNYPGKIGGDKDYAPHELRVAYNDLISPYANGKILQIPSTEPFFCLGNEIRQHTAYYVGKGKDLRKHPQGAIQITPTYPRQRQQLAKLLQSVTLFYTYDNFTMLAYEAHLCGCEVLLIEPDGSIVQCPLVYMPKLDEVQHQLHNFIIQSQML